MVRMLVAGAAALALIAPGGPASALEGDAPHPAPGGVFEAEPFCASEAPPSEAPDTEGADADSIRIGTYNVLFASGTSNASLDARLPLIVDAIAESGADVVGVQEDEQIGSRGYTSERIARALAAATGDTWSWCFFMANAIVPNTPDVYVGGGNPQSDPLMPLGNTLGESVWRTGVGLVSRYPIVDAGAHRLPRRVAEEVQACGDDQVCFFTALVESRVALRALVDAPGGPVHVVSTHLAHTITAFSDLTRIVQADDLLRWIDAFTHGSAAPVVLTGDFNSRPDTEVHDAIVDAGFADTFRVAEPTAAGSTSSQSITAPTSTVSSRIDYVFARAGSCPSPLSAGGGVAASEVVGDAPNTDGAAFLWPSDHYSVVSELQPFPDAPADCPVTFVANYPAQFAAALYGLAQGLGASSIEEVIRWGVTGLGVVAEQGGATPVAVPPGNDGAVRVSVTWSAEEATALEAAAEAWGVDPGQLHHLGGRLVALLVLQALAGG